MYSAYQTVNYLETQKVAEVLFKKIKTNKPGGAKVLALKGDLGSGKTTFTQGLAKAIGVKGKILSPTFIIMKKFQISNIKSKTNFKIQNSKIQNFYHLDCYRIQGAKDLLNLGLKEIFSNPKNIVAVEWAERIKDILPKDVIWIFFKFIDKDTRAITVKFNKKNK